MKRKHNQLTTKKPEPLANESSAPSIEQFEIAIIEPKPMTNHRYSIVSAVYNVSKYLNTYFESLVNQSIQIDGRVELILVDDGSTDESAAIIKHWQTIYPKTIRYIYQENAGQGAARNNGLRYAKNEWVTFIDPDDFISENYFEEIDKCITKNKTETPLKMVCANYIFYYEDLDQFKDTHPLKFRFAKGECILPVSNMGKHIILNVNCAFFKRTRLLDKNIRFNPAIRPAFEDGNFVNNYLLSLEDGYIAYLDTPKYYYRKRQDGSSTLDTGWAHQGRYQEQLELGYLDIINVSLRKYGHVKDYIQRTVLYDLSWHFKRFINHNEKLAHLSTEQRDKYTSLISKIMEFVSEDIIISFELAGMWFYQKQGLLSYYKSKLPSFNIAYIDELDELKDLVKVKYYSNTDSVPEKILLDDEIIIPEFSTVRKHELFGRLFTYERIFWVRLGDSKKFKFTIENTSTRMSLRGKQYRDGVLVKDIHEALGSKWVLNGDCPADLYAVREMHLSGEGLTQYGACWLFMDRDTQADDNAEHLYRYVLSNKPNIRSFFVLNESAPDWARLKNEGFNLIGYGTTEHKLALLNADHLISSHADHYVFGGLENKWFGDLLTYKFTFLQHGVTKDDLSSWLNGKNIDCFVTATPPEYESITCDGGYKFTHKEVFLTGFARHDRLRSLSNSREKTILVMPTWRNSLVGPATGMGNEREVNPLFATTGYYRHWQEFLSSPDIERLVRDNGYRLIFFPHANIQPYLNTFNIPTYIEIAEHHPDKSMQLLLSRAGILITDYSSIAFETAVINRAVMYYQFDASEVFSGAHIYKPGYFSYEEHGFGPISTTLESVIEELGTILSNGGLPALKYAERMKSTFAFEDTDACERIFDAIESLNRSELIANKTAPAALEFSSRSINHQQWRQAEIACNKVLHSAAKKKHKSHAAYSLAKCQLALGNYLDAQKSLDCALESGYPSHEIDKLKLLVAIEVEDFGVLNTFHDNNCKSPETITDPQIIALTSRSFRAQGRYDEAATFINRCELADDSITLERAEIAFYQNRWIDAHNLLSSLTIKTDRVRFCLAKTSRQLGHSAEALKLIQNIHNTSSALEFDSELAEIYYSNGQWKLADAHWKKIEIPTLEFDTWLKISKTRRKLGNFAQARESLSLAHLAEDQRTYLQERALLLSAMKDWEEAIEAWSTFIFRKHLRANRDAWLHLAEAQLGNGDIEGATTSILKFESFGEITKKSASLWKKLGAASH